MRQGFVRGLRVDVFGAEIDDGQASQLRLRVIVSACLCPCACAESDAWQVVVNRLGAISWLWTRITGGAWPRKTLCRSPPQSTIHDMSDQEAHGTAEQACSVGREPLEEPGGACESQHSSCSQQGKIVNPQPPSPAAGTGQGFSASAPHQAEAARFT